MGRVPAARGEDEARVVWSREAEREPFRWRREDAPRGWATARGGHPYLKRPTGQAGLKGTLDPTSGRAALASRTEAAARRPV